MSVLDEDSTRHMKDVAKEINLLDAVYLLSEAWEDVKSATIANCCRHAGFVKDPVIESVEFDVFHNIPLSTNMS